MLNGIEQMWYKITNIRSQFTSRGGKIFCEKIKRKSISKENSYLVGSPAKTSFFSLSPISDLLLRIPWPASLKSRWGDDRSNGWLAILSTSSRSSVDEFVLLTKAVSKMACLGRDLLVCFMMTLFLQTSSHRTIVLHHTQSSLSF